MALVTPATLFPGATADATGITIPYTALGGLTQAEANPTTGNGVKVLFEILDAAATRHAALAADAKSARMTLTRGNLAVSGTNLSRSYSAGITFAAPSGLDVADEP